MILLFILRNPYGQELLHHCLQCDYALVQLKRNDVCYKPDMKRFVDYIFMCYFPITSCNSDSRMNTRTGVISKFECWEQIIE